MNTLLLEPSDVMFFRDGRPMSGALSGHGSAWPLPTVTSAALHAALHRADLEKSLGGEVHGHDHHRPNGVRVTDARKFGGLVTAGPFPVLKDGTWLFPRPLDAALDEDENDYTVPAFLPLATNREERNSSLPEPLKLPVANRMQPTKATPAPWWTAAAWKAYLANENIAGKGHFQKDSAFADTEFAYGIGIDPETSTQDGERFYSAHFLRLQPGCRIGLLASAPDKKNGDPNEKRDLMETLFPNSGAKTSILVGGQQRLCSVERHANNTPLPLPAGMSDGFLQSGDQWLVKWVMLTPAVFPFITAGTSKRGTQRKKHPGGWLPSWICPGTGRVMLETVSPEERRRRRQLNYGGKGYDSHPDIGARLVAAMVGKPVTVSGYALPHEIIDRNGGAKPTHLAVPAGSVYYFECDDKPAAKALAAALNWHAAGDLTKIRNRRSTLFGEKGFGLGVCGTWRFHDGKCPS